MHDIPLNETQRIFADKNHNLVYKFLHEKNLNAAGQCAVNCGRAVQRCLRGGKNRMKKRKLELYITGKLMSALMGGRPAIFSTGGEMYHTAPVVKIHETETQEIHFETSTTHYYIKPRPFVLAVLNPRRQTPAACA